MKMPLQCANVSRLWLIAVLIAANTVVQAQTKNGFDLSDALIPADQILSGGPPRDGIPAIDAPRFVNASAAHHLQPTDRVLGIVRGGVVKAYPVSIMNWHEIVNDSFADEPVVVTYCPLCGTGIAYLANAGEQVLTFGVSGLLFNSDMLLYDRQTLSLWSQIQKQAISGPEKGTRLQAIPLQHTTWADWRDRHPDSLVLTNETGYSRDYRRNPYSGYTRSRNLYFPVQQQDKRYHPKEPVLGVELNGQFKAYPFSELEKTDGQVRDKLGGQDITVKFDRRHRTAVVINDKGDHLPSITAFWFAWYAFHPDTDVFSIP